MNIIRKWLGKPGVVFSSTSITNKELRDLLHSRFPSAQVWLSDGDYRLCSGQDMDKILEADDTNKGVYKADTFDCDDFAYRLMGQLCIPEYSDLAFGIVWTDLHAMNVFVDNSRQVWFLEPQSDERKLALDTWQGSKVLLVVV